MLCQVTLVFQCFYTWGCQIKYRIPVKFEFQINNDNYVCSISTCHVIFWIYLRNYALFIWNSNVTDILYFSLQNMATLITCHINIPTGIACSWPGYSYLQESLGHIVHPNCKTNGSSFSELKGEEWVDNYSPCHNS